MNEINNIEVKLLSNQEVPPTEVNEFESIIFDLDSQINILSSKADKWDCLVALGSGVACAMMDILWTKDFSLIEGRDLANDKVENLVRKTAQMMGCDSDDLKKCVKFLEDKFPIPSDGNTPDFGGGLQHHLRDFAHHPTIIGLIFSLLTQFTYKSYGTDVAGNFMIVDVPEKSRIYIGEDTSSKIINGTIVWFFHLISDIAGSSSTAGLSGGTGIPGPILSIAKEMSCLPIFKNIHKNDTSLSVLLSKMFNGTLFAKHDENGQIIRDSIVKLDFRGEIGFAVEIEKQAIPVVANECIVRTFYMIRQLARQIKEIKITRIEDFKKINIKEILPFNSPTLTRMLTIATGVFTALDVSEAVVTKKYWVSINYVEVGRFTLALGDEMVWALKRRDIRLLKDMYETIYRNTYTNTDQRIYQRMGDGMDYDKLGLNEEQTAILYNIEYYKTLNDAYGSKIPVGGEKIRQMKLEWLNEWKGYMTKGFKGFMNNMNAELNWYSLEELHEKIRLNSSEKPWFRLVLLEAMLFEPYFPLKTETDKKGKEVPSNKYSYINAPITGYKKSEGDRYLDSEFSGRHKFPGYVKRLRKCYDKVCREMNEVLKTAITSITITAGVAIVTIATAGALASPIAVALSRVEFCWVKWSGLNKCLPSIFRWRCNCCWWTWHGRRHYCYRWRWSNSWCRRRCWYRWCNWCY